MKYYNFIQAPLNTPLWGCAYETTDSEKRLSLKKEPVKGIIVIEYGYRFFYELKKNGEIKKSSKVYSSSRIYADTLEESIEMYNEKIDSQIQFLEGLIQNCVKDKVFKCN